MRQKKNIFRSGDNYLHVKMRDESLFSLSIFTKNENVKSVTSGSIIFLENWSEVVSRVQVADATLKWDALLIGDLFA